MPTDETPLAVAYLTGELAGTARPRNVGRKFDPSGRPLSFPGNTFLCHVPAQGAGHAALVAVQARLRAMPFADAFAWLPPSSFHMTVFEGVTDADREPESWPAGLSTRAPVAAITDEFLLRTEGLALPSGFSVRPTRLFAGTMVMVTGALEADSAALWKARSLLREATGIRRVDFMEYRCHITLSYPLRWLAPEEARHVATLSDSLCTDLIHAAPAIALGPVEFCSFETMHHFEPLRRFG